MRGSLRFFKDPLLDDGVHIGRREGEAGVKAALNFREVVALDLGNGINVLLAGHDDPRLAHTLLAQFLRHRLEVEHEFGIVPDVLANLIHQKDDMVVMALAVDVGLYPLGKILNADGVWFNGLLTPVSRRNLAHEVHGDESVHYAVLNEVEILPGGFPRLTVFLLKGSFKLVIAAFLGQPALQISHVGNGSAESLHFIEDLEKHIDDSVFVLFTGGLALRINIEEDNICGGLCGQFHISQHHGVNDLFVLNEIVQSLSTAHLAVLQKVGEDLQEMRFTASKEAGDPDAHLRRCTHNTLFISRVEIRKVFLQFPRDNIFL